MLADSVVSIKYFYIKYTPVNHKAINYVVSLISRKTQTNSIYDYFNLNDFNGIVIYYTVSGKFITAEEVKLGQVIPQQLVKPQELQDSIKGEYLVNILDSINTIKRRAVLWPIVVSIPTFEEKYWFGNMCFMDYLVFVICEGSKIYKDYSGSIITPVEGSKRRLKMKIREDEGEFFECYNQGVVISKEEAESWCWYIKGESSIPKEMILEKVE